MDIWKDPETGEEIAIDHPSWYESNGTPMAGEDCGIDAEYSHSVVFLTLEGAKTQVFHDIDDAEENCPDAKIIPIRVQ